MITAKKGLDFRVKARGDSKGPSWHLHNMENLMVIRVKVIAPEKPLLSKHLQK